jgi:hypothetical protein
MIMPGPSPGSGDDLMQQWRASAALRHSSDRCCIENDTTSMLVRWLQQVTSAVRAQAISVWGTEATRHAHQRRPAIVLVWKRPGRKICQVLLRGGPEGSPWLSTVLAGISVGRQIVRIDAVLQEYLSSCLPSKICSIGHTLHYIYAWLTLQQYWIRRIIVIIYSTASSPALAEETVCYVFDVHAGVPSRLLHRNEDIYVA